MRPDNLDARYNLAVLLGRSGHGDAAFRLYQENLERGRHLPSAINLSVLYIKRGERNKARRLLEKTNRHFRHEAVPLYMLGEMAAEDGDAALADEYFRKALRADPLNGFAHLRYARFLAARKRWPKALERSGKAVRLLPDCAPCHRIRGDILRGAGKPAEALAAYQRSIALNPDHDTRLRLIAALDAMGEHDRARIMRRAMPENERGGTSLQRAR